MAEAIPEIYQEGIPDRQHVARLRFVPDQILFEGLKRFYANPHLVRRVGQNAMNLYSLASTDVDLHTYRPFGIANESFGMPDVERIDHDLRQLNHNDRRLAMTDHLSFSRLKNDGIAIELAVELNPAVAEALQETGFIAADTSSVDVDLKLVTGQHAGGIDMQQAARHLQEVLNRQSYPRPGIEAVNLVIKR